MDKYDWNEIAYKNGYEKGYKEAALKMAEWLKGKCTQGVCPNAFRLRECELEKIVKELMEESLRKETEKKDN